MPPKTKKAKVNEEAVDSGYVDKRKRNNDAVKKSRDKTKKKTEETVEKVQKLKEKNKKLEGKIDEQKKTKKFLIDLAKQKNLPVDDDSEDEDLISDEEGTDDDDDVEKSISEESDDSEPAPARKQPAKRKKIWINWASSTNTCFSATYFKLNFSNNGIFKFLIAFYKIKFNITNVVGYVIDEFFNCINQSQCTENDISKICFH
ncbi:unnamed protein product [Chironomus riparius]|uniref:BZIP domain-containing protein n=1 Tax=Chironomus riparius TaxID=315576 RepID=A0A9N9RMI5_9DIPT|nr:unnamed protein product [Chironomus riparius]